jgi:acyl-CoA reductase-like NAD-dependent aldehyde dehydrogenase
MTDWLADLDLSRPLSEDQRGNLIETIARRLCEEAHDHKEPRPDTIVARYPLYELHTPIGIVYAVPVTIPLWMAWCDAAVAALEVALGMVKPNALRQDDAMMPTFDHREWTGPIRKN